MILSLRILIAVIALASVANAFCGDSEESKTMQVTEALNDKWRAIFGMMDRDGNGVYTLEECYAVTKDISDYYNSSQDLIAGFAQFCVLYNGAVGGCFGQDKTETGVTKPEYVMAHGWYWSNHFDLVRERVDAFYVSLFHAMDSDNDGVVTFKELRAYYKIFGDSDSIKEKARKVFNLIDADGDGVVDEDEYRDIYLKYATDPDITIEELPLY